MRTTRRRSTGSAAARPTVLPAARLLVIVALAHLAAPLGAQTQGRESELSTPGTERHAQAVDLARAGRYARALEILSELRATDPDNASLLYDETIVLGWTERDSDVLERVESLERLDPSAFVRATVGKAARNLGRYDVARRWYESALAMDPSDPDARLGLAMTYADQGALAEAERVLAALPEADAREPEAQLARAYVRGRAGAPFEALNSYNAVLARTPNDAAALRGKALALRSLLLPTQALALAEAHPGTMTDAEIERLRADVIALDLRLTTRTPYRPARLAAELDATVESLEAELARDPPPSVAAALEDDRIVALADGYRTAEAVAAFERRTGDEPAPYVLAAAGKAYLRERQPERAVGVLERAVAADPGNLEHEFALFYAYLDLERHERALGLALRLIERLPVTRAEPGSSVIKGNDEWIRAQIAAALAEAGADDLADAQRRLEPLLAELPNNSDLRHELANVYHWRGWNDRALFEYAQVLTVDPDLLAARAGRAHTLLDARSYGEFETELSQLNEAYAPEAGVQRLNERWELHNRSELRVTADTGDSSGATFGTRQRSIDATWLTAPIREHFRAFARVHDAFAAFPEGDSRRRRVGAGIEYRDPLWIATGEVSVRRGGGDAGLNVQGERRLDDRWSLMGRLELDSDDTQLRAHRVDVETDLVGIGARFAPHESAAVEVGIARRELSDGNDATAAFAVGRRRVLNRSRWSLDLTGELRTSRNARQDVPYFSPARDLTLLVGASHEWRIFRRYERGIAQTVELQMGEYGQSDARDGRIWRLGYEMRFDVSRRLGFTVGAERYRMFYDGAPEYGTSFVVTANARF